ncbi:uncharacterized protein LOC124649140 isoform X2 [Lolium rigidum]|uniref:uncharacterized protein LOC124649140 isoform X2 n=1 Tax=Lolium rigidum TaxID=89674 RepID=UPI001F5D59C2|nr:uncharacterized protein LOC124649140 isoform X2 [Lolium rigidum]
MGLGPFGRPTLGGVDEHTRKRVPDVEDRTEAAVAATHPTVSLPTSPPLLVPIGLANHMIIDYHNDEFSGLSPWLNRIACFGRGGWDRLQSEGCKGDCGEVLQCSSPQGFLRVVLEKGSCATKKTVCLHMVPVWVFLFPILCIAVAIIFVEAVHTRNLGLMIHRLTDYDSGTLAW